jgi:hypothetical protein
MIMSLCPSCLHQCNQLRLGTCPSVHGRIVVVCCYLERLVGREAFFVLTGSFSFRITWRRTFTEGTESVEAELTASAGELVGMYFQLNCSIKKLEPEKMSSK